MNAIRDTGRGAGWVLLVGIATLIVAVLLGAMWIFGIGWFQRGTADFRGQTGLIERTKANAAFRQQAYDHFFDLCSAVQGDEGRIEALEEENAASPTPERRTQIQASITAVRSSRTEKIRTYNNDAAKDWTVGQFRANDLPARLDPNGESTTCAA